MLYRGILEGLHIRNISGLSSHKSLIIFTNKLQHQRFLNCPANADVKTSKATF